MNQSIKSRRLILTPMDAAALMQKAELETDAHMKAAYGEMLAGVQAHPDKALWYTEWDMRLKSGESVGGVGFHSAPVNGTAEIGYGVDASYRGNGYAAEAVQALCAWGYAHGAYGIQAEAEADNGASKRVLETCGFRCTGLGKEGELWEKEKPKTHWLAICMCLGLSCGCAVGAAIGGALPGASVGIAMSAGLILGVIAGAFLDARDTRKRKESLPPEPEIPVEKETAEPKQEIPAEQETVEAEPKGDKA